jgi:hypothetical protein
MESYSEDEHDLNPYASYYPFPPTYHVAPAASSALNPTYSCLSSSPDQPFQHDNNASHREPSRIWSEDQGLVSTGGPSGSAVPLPAPRAGEKRRKRRQVLSSAAPLQLLCSSFTLACLIWRFHRPLSPASVTRSFHVRSPFSDGRTQLYRGLKLTVPFPSISIQLSRSSIRCWEILRCMLQAFPLPPFDCTSLLGTSVTNPSLSVKLL